VLEAGYEPQQAGVALVGGTLIDGTGRDPLEGSVVLVRGSLIEQTAKKEDVRIPRDLHVVDVTGKTIMPGMIDCHCHISFTTMNVEKRLLTPRTVELFETAKTMKRVLHAGFTTIRDAGTLNDVGFRQAVEMGLVEGPRLVVAGALFQTGGHFDQYYPRNVELPLWGGERCDGVPDVQRAARKVLRKQFDFIKVSATGGAGYPGDSPEHTEWTLEELKAIVYEASARGKAVMAHAISNRGIKNAILAGVWSVEHGAFLDDEAIQMLLQSGTYLVPTLSIHEDYHEREEGITHATMSQHEVDRVRSAQVQSFRRAAAVGVRIATGTDAVREEMHGQNARELELMVRYGYTPMEAIVAATKTASEACRVDGIVGTLETGKVADLLVVDGDPLSDVSMLQDEDRLLLVMKEGRIYVDRMALAPPAPRT
jgi:imidazolonepropionase-like amidohydrolase